MKKWNIEKILGIAMLIFAIGFNLWLYRLEPIATIDPNDNTFQFGLVDRTNTIWDFALKKCSSSIGGILTFPLCHFSYLADHWVHNWADGYNLPYYYSHIPQILIVGSYRFLHTLAIAHYSLFTYYHLVIYLLLCIFPLSVFLALLVMELPWMIAGIGALLATNLSTDGLYGLDPSSFLWRGYGLSSQLFAMIWLPLALAYSYKFFSIIEQEDAKQFFRKLVSSKNSLPTHSLLLAVFFITATTAGHLGIGIITMLSLGFLALGKPLVMLIRQQSLKETFDVFKYQMIGLTLVAGISIFLLSYWILPTFIHGNYHNISFWDPVWKFDSYGWKETMIRLFNGDLFDFGRLPYITLLTLLGVMVALRSTLSPFAFLFIFWLLFYFGRTTWGDLIDLIPGMTEFHLSRFLVGLHVSGMLLAPIGFMYLADRATQLASRYIKTPYTKLLVYFVIGVFIVPPIYRWTVTYNELNDKLIVQANANHAKVAQDEQKLFAKLRSLPSARIYAGRGGSFGKRFEVAETPYFMHLSTYGLPTTLWLPETWSMNSDTEQYFSEDQARDYDLYNMRWVAAPPDQTTQPFWKLIDQSPTWKLYEVPTTGYFTTGVRAATVSVNKRSFVNVEHLWIQSNMSALGIFPELTFNKDYPKPTGLPNFKMLDEVTFQTPDFKKHNIWSEPPVYLPPGYQSIEQLTSAKREAYADIKLTGPEVDDTDMTFKTSVTVGKTCVECMVILKQTYHPNWKAWVDGKRVTPIIVFPFYIGIPVSEPGNHTIVASYEPSTLKVWLLIMAILAAVGASYYALKQKKQR